MEKFRTAAPLVGYLLKSGELASGATASFAGWNGNFSDYTHGRARFYRAVALAARAAGG